MKITKRQLRRIIKEEIQRLNEYGGSHGSVTWYEHDGDVLFDIEGEGDELDMNTVQDILNAPDTDDALASDIQSAISDADDYSGGY